MSFTCPGCKMELKSKRSVGAHTQWNPDCTRVMRFWGYVEKRGPLDCWPYKSRLDKEGYGRFDGKGPMTYAHRCAWIFTNGPIPADKDLMHSCDKRNCCNPRHMKLGDHDANMVDRTVKKRSRNQYSGKLPRELCVAE